MTNHQSAPSRRGLFHVVYNAKVDVALFEIALFQLLEGVRLSRLGRAMQVDLPVATGTEPAGWATIEQLRRQSAGVISAYPT